jgi:hypothetical protein
MSQPSHDRSKNIVTSLSEFFGAPRHFTTIPALASNMNSELFSRCVVPE